MLEDTSSCFGEYEFVLESKISCVGEFMSWGDSYVGGTSSCVG